MSGLEARLAVFANSMAWRGPKASELEKISWIEALGWFHGWEYPARLAERS